MSQTQTTFVRTRKESESKKALVSQTKKDKFTVGIPTSQGIIGVSIERDRSRLEISEQCLQQNQEVVAELKQKSIKQQFEVVQEKEEQNRQNQIEQLPK